MALQPIRFDDPMDAFRKGYDTGNALVGRAAAVRAGRALAGGDARGAASELYGAGMLEQGGAIEDRAADQQTEAAKGEAARRKEAMDFTAQAAQRLRQVYDATPGDKAQKLARLRQGYEQIAPTARQLGVSEEDFAQTWSQIEADPETTLTMMGAAAAKEAGYEIVKGSDGSYVAVDTKTGRPVYQFRQPTTVKLGQGEQLLELPGTGGEGAPQQAAPQDGDDWLSAVAQAEPDALVTSGYRDPQKNASVGGKPNSRHMSGQAVDLVPRPGETMAQLHARVSKVPGVKAINEGDHVHVQATGARGAQPGGARVIAERAPKPEKKPAQRVRLTPEEVAAGGYQPGSVVFRDSETGEEFVKQGPGGGPGKITEGQINAASLAYAAFGGNERMNELAKKGIYKPQTASDSLIQVDKNGIARVFARTEQDRLFIQAAKEFLAPILRKDTGAAVTDSELAFYMDTYIPRFEDSPQVMWQKAQARDTALRRIYGSGRRAYDQEYGPPGKWQVLTDPRGAPKPKTQQAGNVPAEAIAALKRDPRLAGQFDAKYGKGRSAQYLGSGR